MAGRATCQTQAGTTSSRGSPNVSASTPGVPLASLWRDRALLELNVAVLHSFRAAGVRIVDHHSASDQFITHLQREEQAGRQTPGDWSWIVPPMSSSTTAVFHRYYSTVQAGPTFCELAPPWPQGPRTQCPAAA